ncbi:MAG: DNA-3-methyladenine glycosylase 2 family protein [Actinomycetota bacterium]|nr:MAG: DNA-3-methyladenine glycosylase [Actinomycetota bacterium]MDO8950017.1 DNA-3-methyladenine glycosylase 2 family protein [Actinomycetota bacterium]MDP3630190.1 DNA-3-methyladenine glycosylase 2 family protein [Actinomycetota bacterium]
MKTHITLTPDSPEVLHLSAVDPVLGEIISRVGPIDQQLESDAFGSLASAIVSQQLSDAAARTILGRVVGVLDSVAPAAVLAADTETLRGAGLSRSKVAFLQDLAVRVDDGRLDLTALAALTDDEIVDALVSVKGIGRWTAEMFLIFSLGRPDVLAVDDSALRATVAWLYGLDDANDREPIARIGEAWRPYRTAASLYLWRGLALRRAEERAARG